MAAAYEVGASRVVCASAGNLGQAPAYGGRRRGLDVTVAAGTTANPLKLGQVAAFGAEVRLVGEEIEDADGSHGRLPTRKAPTYRGQ